ncbi:MAG: stage II sporulation protein P [Bacillota bacterium]|nr:stage II sporulation protein P [Bacillota bacterium]MDW7683455.1 stage II sporulation protein P [Bacillota bacterium]
MAKSVFFSVRSKRQAQRKSRRAKYFMFALAIFILGAALAQNFGQPAVVPAMAGASSSPEESRIASLGKVVGLHILSQVIPGFKEAVAPLPDEGEEVREDREKPAGFAGFADPRDPKKILAAQIPYMDETGAFLQPLIHQVNQDQMTENDEPKIVIPVRNVLTGTGKVVIYHTHATESFVPTSGRRFTEDLTLTVAQLGEELANMLLTEYGIPVVTDKTIHDIPRSTSYEKALPTINGLLSAHPETELVIDLHRDGVARKVTTAEINGEAAGKILFVVGSRHPHWQENYQKALFLHQVLEEMVPGISRGIRERPLVYNQDVHPGALLIEIGGHENSLSEARRTLPVLARALDRLYHSGL